MTEAPCTATTSRPKIVCLCGSTQFGEAFRKANLAETLAGRIVLTVGCYTHSDKSLKLTRDMKERLDDLHMCKIDLADEVLVLNLDGYIGKSTGNELAYALALKKPVRTLEPMDLEKWAGERDAKARVAGKGNA